MGADQASGRWLAAWLGGGRDCLDHAPRLVHQRPGGRGLGERPRGRQPRARDHELRTVVKRLGVGPLLLATVLVQVPWAPRLPLPRAFPHLPLAPLTPTPCTARVPL